MDDALTHRFRTMARYNAVANGRLHDACERLSDGELKKPREAFFGSIMGTLNHLLVGDKEVSAPGDRARHPYGTSFVPRFAMLRRRTRREPTGAPARVSLTRITLKMPPGRLRARTAALQRRWRSPRAVSPTTPARGLVGIS